MLASLYSIPFFSTLKIEGIFSGLVYQLTEGTNSIPLSAFSMLFSKFSSSKTTVLKSASGSRGAPEPAPSPTAGSNTASEPVSIIIMIPASSSFATLTIAPVFEIILYSPPEMSRSLSWSLITFLSSDAVAVKPLTLKPSAFSTINALFRFARVSSFISYVKLISISLSVFGS